MFLTGFNTEQEALDKSEQLAIAAGIVPTGDNVTKYLFSVVDSKEHGFALSMKKRDVNNLTLDERKKLNTFLPIKNHGLENPDDIKWATINKKDFNSIDFTAILDIPDSIKKDTNGDYIVSYRGEQPSFIFKITKNTIGLPEKAFDDVSGSLYK